MTQRKVRTEEELLRRRRRAKSGYYPRDIRNQIFDRNQREMIERALRGSEPMTLHEARQAELFTREDIRRVIGGLFPLIIRLVLNGESISKIEGLCGIPNKLLARFIFDHPRLDAHIRRARDIRRKSPRIDGRLTTEVEDVLSSLRDE